MSELTERRIYYVLISDDQYREIEAYSLDDVVSFVRRNFRHDKVITDRKNSKLMENRKQKGFHSLPKGTADEWGFQFWRPGDPREI